PSKQYSPFKASKPAFCPADSLGFITSQGIPKKSRIAEMPRSESDNSESQRSSAFDGKPFEGLGLARLLDCESRLGIEVRGASRPFAQPQVSASRGSVPRNPATGSSFS